MRYLAQDIYAFLQDVGCVYEGDRLPNGEAWITADAQVFFLPEPDFANGAHWFDAEVLDDNLKDRWVGFRVPISIRRYPDA